MEMGFIIYGSDDSPVVPLLTFNMPKITYVGSLIPFPGIIIFVRGFARRCVRSVRAIAVVCERQKKTRLGLQVGEHAHV